MNLFNLIQFMKTVHPPNRLFQLQYFSFFCLSFGSDKHVWNTPRICTGAYTSYTVFQFFSLTRIPGCTFLAFDSAYQSSARRATAKSLDDAHLWAVVWLTRAIPATQDVTFSVMAAFLTTFRAIVPEGHCEGSFRDARFAHFSTNRSCQEAASSAWPTLGKVGHLCI